MLEHAQRQASLAAQRAGVVVSLVEDIADLEAVEGLVNRTWGEGTAEISVGLLRALSASGNLVSGAYRDGLLVGACIAFVGGEGSSYLHSHLAAVDLSVRGRGVGFALKTHQRAWALGRGLRSVSWTFDPLVRRNARLNLALLGALPVEFLPDFYGTRDDALNAGVATDRLLVRWDLEDARTQAACSRSLPPQRARDLIDRGAHPLVVAGQSGAPAITADNGAQIVLVGLPGDITAIRRDSPRTADRWREAVRSSLGVALHGGHRVVGFTEHGHYVIDRGER